jgi:hypothetical protein
MTDHPHAYCGCAVCDEQRGETCIAQRTVMIGAKLLTDEYVIFASVTADTKSEAIDAALVLNEHHKDWLL